MARSCRFFGLVACLLAVLPLSPLWAQGPSDFTNGVRYYQANEFSQALDMLQRSVQSDPGNEAAWYFLGMSKFNLKDYQGALDAFQRSSELAPGRPGTRLMIGRIYETTGAYDEAARIYLEELRFRQGRDTLPVVTALGRAIYLSGKYAEASEALQRVVAEDPKYVEALYYYGLAELAQKRPEAAIKLFQAALEAMEGWRDASRRKDRLRAELGRGAFSTAQQRDLAKAQEELAQEYGPAQEFGTTLRLWPDLNKALGDAYLAQGEWTSARNAYRKAMDREQLGNPSDADAYTRVSHAFLLDAKSLFIDDGLLLQAIGVLKDAITAAKTAQEKDPNYAPAFNAMGEVYLFQARTYITRPDLEITSHSCADALKEFQQALKLDPNYITAMTNAAECLLMTDNPAAARDQLNRALTLEPKRADLHAQMAQVLLALEDGEGALNEAQTALATDNKNTVALGAAGKAYMYYRSDLGEAIQHFSEAVDADPKSWEGYVNLGLAFFQMESWYRARQEFRRALDLIPTASIANTADQQAYLHYLVARTYHQAGMYEQEIASLNEALGRNPAHLESLRQLAMAYEAQKKYRAASQVLAQALQVSRTDLEDAETNTQLGGMLERAGQLHEAIAAYSAALQSDPNSLAAQEALARLETP